MGIPNRKCRPPSLVVGQASACHRFRVRRRPSPSDLLGFGNGPRPSAKRGPTKIWVFGQRPPAEDGSLRSTRGKGRCSALNTKKPEPWRVVNSEYCGPASMGGRSGPGQARISMAAAGRNCCTPRTSRPTSSSACTQKRPVTFRQRACAVSRLNGARLADTAAANLGHSFLSSQGHQRIASSCEQPGYSTSGRQRPAGGNYWCLPDWTDPLDRH